MRKLYWPTIVLDLIYIVLGVVFIIRPENVESALCYILSAAVAVIGLIYLIGYFIQQADESGNKTGNGFAFGVLLIIMAIFIVVKQNLVIALVPFLFGIMVLVRGLMIIQGALYLRRMRFPVLVPLCSGLLTMALGIFVMMFPFATATMLFILIGAGLIVGGIAGIVGEVMAWNLARRHEHEKERARDMAHARQVQTITVYDDGREDEEDGPEAEPAGDVTEPAMEMTEPSETSPEAGAETERKTTEAEE